MNVGAAVAIIEDGQILLTKRDDFEVWCLPGGGADAGESMVETAVREVLEETGLDVRLTRMVGIYSMPKVKAWLNLIIPSGIRTWFKMKKFIFTVVAGLGDHKGRPYRSKL